MNNTALAFLAHPDDAEFPCAGTLIRLQKLGWRVHIATATAGDLGSATHDAWETSSIRTQEARRAALQIDAHYHCLGERDMYVAYGEGVLKKSYDLLRRIAPSLVFTHPHRDYMIDHEQVSLIARAATFIYSAPHVSEFPLLPGSQIPYLYYCDTLGGVDPLGQAVQPTTFVDISEVIQQKIAMLSCHESQRAWLSTHHGMDEFVDSMKRHAHERGRSIAVAHAEAFIQHRGHAYPSNDLLQELFGPNREHA